MSKEIFVFGSNLAGIHGAGSALCARQHWGALQGKGVGLQGSSYAIPTKDRDLKVLPLGVIRGFIELFIDYVREHPLLEFKVVKIGCGLAGYSEEEIAPYFRCAPDNCILPDGWRT